MVRRLHHRQRSFRNQPIVICRNERVGTWSQSKMETNSPVAYSSSALLMFPALACS